MTLKVLHLLGLRSAESAEDGFMFINVALLFEQVRLRLGSHPRLLVNGSAMHSAHTRIGHAHEKLDEES